MHKRANRPTQYTPELGARVLARLQQAREGKSRVGLSLRRILDAESMPHERTFLKWRRDHPELDASVAKILNTKPSSDNDKKKPVSDREMKPMQRKCLTCRKLFISAGVHNHVCQPCKSTDHWRSGGYDV